MPLKQILFFIVLGSSALVSAKAMNAIFYANPSWFLVAQIVIGPVLAIILLSNSYKKYRVRMIVGIITFAGIIGLAQIAASLARTNLHGNSSTYFGDINIYHGLLSILYILIFFVWYFLCARKNK